MEIKTTNEIADIWDNTLESDINKTMRTKWVRVDDVNKLLKSKKNLWNSKNVDWIDGWEECLIDLEYELSKGETK